MSDIHLDARREAKAAYPNHERWPHDFTAAQGFEKAALKYLPQLSEKDKVIEGLRKYVQHESTCPVARAWFEIEIEDQPEPPCNCGLTELLSSLAPTGTR